MACSRKVSTLHWDCQKGVFNPHNPFFPERDSDQVVLTVQGSIGLQHCQGRESDARIVTEILIANRLGANVCSKVYFRKTGASMVRKRTKVDMNFSCGNTTKIACVLACLELDCESVQENPALGGTRSIMA
jgi:hypothetical protein